MSLIQQKITAWGAILVVGLVDLALSIPLYLYFKRKNWI
jgi:hypothetical protein